MSRRLLFLLCAALALPVVSCGDEETKTPDKGGSKNNDGDDDDDTEGGETDDKADAKVTTRDAAMDGTTPKPTTDGEVQTGADDAGAQAATDAGSELDAAKSDGDASGKDASSEDAGRRRDGGRDSGRDNERDAGEQDSGAGDEPDANMPMMTGGCGPEHDQCSTSEFCNTEPDDSCGADNKVGKCETRGRNCGAVLGAGVCGCDDKPYDNACDAHSFGGVSVKKLGPCTEKDCTDNKGTVKTGNGFSPPQCDNGQDSYPITGGLRPVICCVARGETTEPPPEMPPPADDTCRSGDDCDDDEYCEIGTKACGAEGTCAPKPTNDDCDGMQPAPFVCGCDGKRYQNRCEAHLGGTSVKTDDLTCILNP